MLNDLRKLPHGRSYCEFFYHVNKKDLQVLINSHNRMAKLVVDRFSQRAGSADNLWVGNVFMRALTKVEIDLIAGASHGNGSSVTVTGPPRYPSTWWPWTGSGGTGGSGSGGPGGGGGPSNPPDVTSSDFNLDNPSAHDLQNLEISLAYLQASPLAKALLQQAKDAGITIHFVHDGHPYGDPGTKDLYWDPDAALRLSNGELQSAALGLIHELGHMLYGDINNMIISDPTFDSLEERNDIVNIESPIALELGEPTAPDHHGVSETETDPTHHS